MAQTSVKTMMPTRPRGDRRLSLLPGKLVYGAQLHTLDCTIRNQSDGGVKLRLASIEALPGRLIFLDLKTRKVWDAEVTWRRLPEIGLRLLTERDPRIGEGPEAIVIRRLLAEAGPRTASDLS